MSGFITAKKVRRPGGFFLVFIIILLALLASFAASFVSKLAQVDPRAITRIAGRESTKIYDRNGRLLYDVTRELNRTKVPFADIPKPVIDAAIVTEDRNFYNHIGIDPKAIVRAAIVNLKTRSRRQGGSTITQQFVRNVLLDRDKTFSRKYKEIMYALALERRYDKRQILEMYFNEIPYGSNIYGIGAAAGVFFGKEAKDLTFAEAAYLAALPKAPTFYSPYGTNREALDRRAGSILDHMRELGYISDLELSKAKSQKVAFQQVNKLQIIAPHFVFYVLDWLTARYGQEAVTSGGLKVFTSLDLNLQKIAEEAVARQVPVNERQYRATNASLVALDPRSGQILAMVGSRNFFDQKIDGQVNVALRPRQPGSSFKPYVYAQAFSEGMSPATMLVDVTTNFGNYGGKTYTPRNYNGRNYGPVPIRKALAGSLNIPAVKTLLLVGVDDAVDMAARMGISTLHAGTYGPAIVLGGAEVKLLEHTASFGVFAASGTRYEITPVLRVTDWTGEVIEDFTESPGRQVLDPQIAYQITSILSDNEARSFIFGKKNKLILPDRPVAAKTGTTSAFRDAWTVGYTPSIAAGVWVGNNDNTPMRPGADGSYVAAPIWNEFMRRALEGTPVEQFQAPPGIIELAVDAFSGKLAGQGTTKTKTEFFSELNEPTEVDDSHVTLSVGESKYLVTTLRSEKPDDPAWEGPVRRWALQNGYAYAGAMDEIVKRLEEEEAAKQFFPLPPASSAATSTDL